MLNTRDAQGYPLQGYDFFPKPKDTLSELIKLLQQANEREHALNPERGCGTLASSLQHSHSRAHGI